MAGKKGSRKTKRKPRLPLYFFVDNKLYRKLRVVVAEDWVTAWSYSEHTRVGFTYSTLLREHKRAFTTTEVAGMIGRDRTRVTIALANGDIEPHRIYNLTTKRPTWYYWSEEDIMDLHDFFLTVHRGRPRLDGGITPQAMPSKRELRAMIRQEQIMYIQNDDGEFVPTWRAAQF